MSQALIIKPTLSMLAVIFIGLALIVLLKYYVGRK